MSSKSKVLLIGSGGVGTIASYVLESNGKAEVTSVIRSDYQLVLDSGYQIKSIDYGEINNFRPSHIVNNVLDSIKYGPFDYVVVTTKNQPDIFSIEELIAPVIIKEKTTIVLIQNGFGIEKTIIEKFPGTIVLSGVQMISSTLYDGIIDQPGPDSMSIGIFNNNISTKNDQYLIAQNFISLYSNEKNNCYYDENVKYTRWRKLVYNATLNSTCALTDLDVGRVELFGGVDTLIKPAMKEVLAIAKSDGVELPESIMEFMIRSDDGVWYSPSMLVDLRKGNFIESVVILGNALDVAKENGISAPTLTVLYNLLQLIQARTKERKGLIKLPIQRPISNTTN
ncbi:hypothetical protein PACTADRAFT_49102 [Pachysolen tannophilus NRRL Y-2460]|uniref:2-dehydropantoate 2-reductase n=1 Tax=Pachysolen tannophilus NRRL Y-2460 TaxID=669874 RepID=A0A1E4U064_PACTA|nr:hypothetical protein PACTADRAFT_49102 [Pachysolen tannophilus NRRL Y-2460]